MSSFGTNTFAVARLEWRRLTVRPLAWVLAAITLASAKRYYLHLLARLDRVPGIEARWPAVFDKLSERQTLYYGGGRGDQQKDHKKENKRNLEGMFVSTKDAWTLTDGPSIFICENIENMGKFCLAQADIPARVLDELSLRIARNNLRLEEISRLESELEEKER